MDRFVFYKPAQSSKAPEKIAELHVPHDGYLYGVYAAQRVAEALRLPTGWTVDITRDGVRDEIN